jgi:hypothetical protein
MKKLLTLICLCLFGCEDAIIISTDANRVLKYCDHTEIPSCIEKTCGMSGGFTLPYTTNGFGGTRVIRCFGSDGSK